MSLPNFTTDDLHNVTTIVSSMVVIGKMSYDFIKQVRRRVKRMKELKKEHKKPKN